jgi:hypothetical protein
MGRKEVELTEQKCLMALRGRVWPVNKPLARLELQDVYT